jgi:hypothetical protein
MFLRNGGIYSQVNMALQPTIPTPKKRINIFRTYVLVILTMTVHLKRLCTSNVIGK